MRTPTDLLAATNGSRRSLLARTFDQLVRKTLVIPLAMVVGRGRLQGSQMPLTEGNNAVEAFRLD